MGNAELNISLFELAIIFLGVMLTAAAVGWWINRR